MFRILLKKQMTEIFRAYFYDAKKNKKRSVFSTVLFFGFFIILIPVCICQRIMIYCCPCQFLSGVF